MDQKAVERLKARYFRPTMAHPEGAYGHHGDCEVHSSDVCTCALLHDLLPLAPGTQALYPAFRAEWNRQEAALEEIRLRKMGAV